MRAIRRPDGSPLVAVELDDPVEGFGLAEAGPDHEDYGKWLALAEDGEDPQPRARG